MQNQQRNHDYREYGIYSTVFWFWNLHLPLPFQPPILRVMPAPFQECSGRHEFRFPFQVSEGSNKRLMNEEQMQGLNTAGPEAPPVLN